ncbi:hypothetical protein ASPZODRAFT_70873 [Penicilliopsis zonata CBS 506.65]|uniref:Pre-rRNA processing protein n=1 Tax=Penicilliopsis zonata CBS 506.65 TaxID=1073090 RepID=A0A1L9SBX8_9EURO|nr:hypothetical protein ASPZODRAFT_70873 [Penicilliopsis zonata CBS 506.65]OJJ44715.1 hypothetical protein ASPZODRAFT_70873 [Penicilliopsis zonata CBS 506.65]
MADEANTPLLDRDAKPVSPHHHYNSSFHLSSESTPLLNRRDDGLVDYGARSGSPAFGVRSDDHDDNDHDNEEEEEGRKKPQSRARLVSLSVLIISVLVILVLAFATPAVVKEYAQQAAVFQPTTVSLDSPTEKGARVRVQGDFVLDSSRVHKSAVRNIGRFATWIAREVQTGQSDVKVYLPQYGGLFLGTASLPSITFNIRDHHVNHKDFLVDLTAGDLQGLRPLADDWLQGRLGHLSIQGIANVPLRSGLLNIGTQILSDTVTIKGDALPSFPQIDIKKLAVHDTNSTEKTGAMAVDVSLDALIDLPVSITVPPLAFTVLVPNCSPGDPYIVVADADTAEIHVKPGAPTNVDATGIIERLPEELTTACPGKKDSPLDLLVTNYMQGLENTIYVRGADSSSLDTPDWMVDLLKDVTVPVPFTGHALGNLVKNFSMSDVHFSLPDPFAEPESPESQPRVSALVKVLIDLPEQMNFQVDVPRVRANADVFYLGDKLGELDLHKWHQANSTLTDDTDGSPVLFVEFQVDEAPLRVTDEDVFTDVIQALVFGQDSVELHVTAAVDAEVTTGLGLFAIHGIPAEGDVAVKAPYGGAIDQLDPRIESIELDSSSQSSLLVKAHVNFTNPTPYSATVPVTDFALLYNGTIVGHLRAANISVIPGLNSGMPVSLLWCPLDASGQEGVVAGRKMLSQYVSGFNTTVTVQSHKGTFPNLPRLGKAMSKLAIHLQIPKLFTPGDGGDDDNGDTEDGASRFIKDATLHLFSSTADFSLASPLPKTSIFITSINATAFYDTTEPIGAINYSIPFEVPPGISQTPRIPVDLYLGGIGYDAVKRAIGGTLKMDAIADVGVRIGEYLDTITYKGKGIGAKVRF